MNLKVLVFDTENSLRELLRIFLSHQGHEVQVFRDPSVCPVYRNLLSEHCCCPRETPCADVVMMDIDMPNISAIDFLKLQRKRGCKALDANKAVMSGSQSSVVHRAMTEFGCHHITKPFRLGEIKRWVEECAERLASSRQSD